MKKITALIVDDELFARDILKKLVNFNCPEVMVIDEAFDVESAVEKITQLKPDLVFLDVHLANDISFNIFDKLTEKSFDIIFTSAHSEYGVSAFKVNAVDYLLKPIDSDDLVLAVEKVLNKRKSSLNQVQNELFITAHLNGVVENIALSQISSMIAQDNYTQLLTLDGKKYLISKTLGELEEKLAELDFFIRVHRGALINSKHILNYTKTNPYLVSMSDGNTFEISRRKKSEVLNKLKQVKV